MLPLLVKNLKFQKPRCEWTSEDKKKTNLDNVANDILYKNFDNITFEKKKMCSTAKEIGKIQLNCVKKIIVPRKTNSLWL